MPKHDLTKPQELTSPNINDIFFEELEEQVEAHHRQIIDEAPRVRLILNGESIIAARIEVGEDRIPEYWDPNTYRMIETPDFFVEGEINPKG